MATSWVGVIRGRTRPEPEKGQQIPIFGNPVVGHAIGIFLRALVRIEHQGLHAGCARPVDIAVHIGKKQRQLVELFARQAFGEI